MTLLQEELIESALSEQNNTTSNNNQSYDQNHTDNMQRHCETALLAKLQEMVPIMPNDGELTKLEIINYVIDYIKHLQNLVKIENSL